MINPFKTLDSVIDKMYEKHQIPKASIEAVIKSEFEFIQKVMNRGDCESVRLMYLGLFRVTPGRRLLAVDLRVNHGIPKAGSDISGVEELDVPKSGSGEGSQEKSGDML